MAKQKKTEFQTFLDGICSFWVEDKNRSPKKVMGGVRFSDRVVGIKRDFLARQAGISVQRVIRVPMWAPDPTIIKPGMWVVANGQQYQVVQAQKKPETIPLSMDITLENPEIFLQFDPQEGGSCGRY